MVIKKFPNPAGWIIQKLKESCFFNPFSISFF
jgi:hypothetical protein